MNSLLCFFINLGGTNPNYALVISIGSLSNTQAPLEGTVKGTIFVLQVVPIQVIYFENRILGKFPLNP